jgi:hypothetical protein
MWPQSSEEDHIRFNGDNSGGETAVGEKQYFSERT